MSPALFDTDGTPRRNPMLDVLRHIAGYSCFHRGQTPTVAVIAADLGITRDAVNGRLQRLEARGAIRRTRMETAPGRPWHIGLRKLPDFTPIAQAPWFDTEAALFSDWGGSTLPAFACADTSKGAASHA